MEHIQEKVINSIRFLSVDAVEKAKSGHPGMPLGAAHIGFLLFDKFLRYNPKNPRWLNRDRFVLSNGHGSMLLYSLLYLYGFDLTIEDIKNFRQIDSKTPGHPEFHITKGVETTTGPLGQGIANAVGMAMAERHLEALFNKEDIKIINNRVFVIVGDGDLMEGLSYEAASLAGHLELSNLIVIWDNNKITIDGKTDLAFTEDVLKRFEAQNWYTIHIEDGYNLKLLEEAINKALNQNKPSFISVRTHIGYGSPLQDSEKSHGAPLGKENVLKTRENLNWPYEEFHVPFEVLEYTRRKVEEGQKLNEEWDRLFESYKEKYPDLARILKEEPNFEEAFNEIEDFNEDMATRQAFGKILNRVYKKIPRLFGGSADLHESNNTYIHNEGDFERYNYLGKNIHFGVREHAMGAILNGMAYYGYFIPYGGTFLVFSDYMRPSIRLAALSKLRVIYVFTHDSIGLGEDGPTHQPVEHIPSLRLIPNLFVFRPADANELKFCFLKALERKEGPSALVLSRQKLKTIDRKTYKSARLATMGAYRLKGVEDPDIVIIASGSEVNLALEVLALLENDDIKADVVSAPCLELFDKMPKDYKEEVIPPYSKKVVIEAAKGDIWYKYGGQESLIISMESFGKSGKAEDLFKHFGFDKDSIYKKIKERFYS